VLSALLLGAVALLAATPAASAAIHIDDVEVAETNGATVATFTVTRRAGLLAGATRASFATTDASAHAPGDYHAASGTLFFDGLLLGGTQVERVGVTVQGDAIDEPTETFRVVLSGDEVAGGVGVARIVDDDPSPAVGAGDAPAAAEGQSAMFTIALSAPSGRDVAVAFTTANGSALAGQDYTARSGTIAIPAGAGSVSVGVPLLNDSADEPNETFELRLSAPSGATLGGASATGTILDTDGPRGTAPPPPPPASGQSPASGPPATSGSSAGGLPRLGISSPRLQRPSTILVTVSCPREAGSCSGRVTIFNRPSRRSRIRALRVERRLGRRIFTLPGGGSRTLRIALSRRDRRLLRRAGRISVRAYAVTQDAQGRTGVRSVNGTLIGRTTHSN
jgi:Calx-beta domain